MPWPFWGSINAPTPLDDLTAHDRHLRKAQRLLSEMGTTEQWERLARELGSR